MPPQAYEMTATPGLGTDKSIGPFEDKNISPHVVSPDIASVHGDASASNTAVHRGLKVRHIQLIAISGAIGAGVFISIGGPLTSAGPLPLIIGVGIWCSVIFCFSNSVIEMCTLLPVPGGYLTYAGRWLDPSVRFASGYNNVLSGCAFVCFELTAMHVVVQYWAPNLNPAVVITVGLVLLTAANGISVRLYGEIEFWISILKVILMLGLFLFTFITMVGGNPLGDRYGFRYWVNPGLFASATVAGRFRGVWSGVTWGAFAVGLNSCLWCQSTIFRVLFFYMGSALAVTINCPYDSPELLGAIAAGAPGAAASPYIINMNRLKIPVLPSIVNAIVLTSIFSTGSSFMFLASRLLHKLATEGQAPRFLGRTNRFGTPYFAVGTVSCFGCLAYLTLNSNSAVVLTWFVSLTTACTLMTWIVIGLTYVRFRAGLKAQNMQHILPVRGWLQPFSAWWSLSMAIFTLIFSGSYLMPAGAFTVPDFLFSYLAVFLYIFNFSFWKIKGLLNGTQRGIGIRIPDMDFVSGLDEIERLTEQDTIDIEAERAQPKSVGAKVDRFFF